MVVITKDIYLLVFNNVIIAWGTQSSSGTVTYPITFTSKPILFGEMYADGLFEVDFVDRTVSTHRISCIARTCKIFKYMAIGF